MVCNRERIETSSVSARALTLTLVLSACFFSLFAACSGAEEPVDGAWTTVGDAWSDVGAVDEDGADATAAADGVQSDATAASDSAAATDGGVDGGAVDTTVADAGGADSGLVDTGMVDTGPGDIGPVDTGPVDAGPADTGPADTGPADTGGGVCADKASAYAAAKIKALKCTSDFQCYAPAAVVEGKGFVFGAPENIGCGCDRYYSDVDLAGQSLADLNGEFLKAGCQANCPKSLCTPLETQVGVCKSGGCVTTTATCKEMEALVSAAVTAGQACKVDSECSNFGMQGSIPCGCPVNVNLSTLAPGKPLFLYITMVTRAYNSLGCANNVVCACQAIGKGACVQGMCVTK